MSVNENKILDKFSNFEKKNIRVYFENIHFNILILLLLYTRLFITFTKNLLSK